MTNIQICSQAITDKQIILFIHKVVIYITFLFGFEEYSMFLESFQKHVGLSCWA